MLDACSVDDVSLYGPDLASRDNRMHALVYARASERRNDPNFKGRAWYGVGPLFKSILLFTCVLSDLPVVRMLLTHSLCCSLSLCQALFTAESKAREAITMRTQIQKELAAKEKSRKEAELRALAMQVSDLYCIVLYCLGLPEMGYACVHGTVLRSVFACFAHFMLHVHVSE